VIVVYHQIRNISAISWQEQVTFDRDDNDASFVLDENTELDFDSANSLNQHAVGRHIAPLPSHYHDSELTSLCSYFLMLCTIHFR
jgi:hypothetical protein